MDRTTWRVAALSSAATLVLVSLIGGAYLLGRSTGEDSPDSPDVSESTTTTDASADARTLARRACDTIDHADDPQLDENGEPVAAAPEEQIEAGIRRGVDQARRAAARDAQWNALHDALVYWEANLLVTPETPDDVIAELDQAINTFSRECERART